MKKLKKPSKTVEKGKVIITQDPVLLLNVTLKVSVPPLNSLPFFYEEVGTGAIGKKVAKIGLGKAGCFYFWLDKQRYALSFSDLAEPVFRALDKEEEKPAKAEASKRKAQS